MAIDRSGAAAGWLLALALGALVPVVGCGGSAPPGTQAQPDEKQQADMEQAIRQAAAKGENLYGEQGKK